MATTSKVRLHTTVCRLAGTDDRLVRVEIDRAVAKVGGIWITWRQMRDGTWQVHDAHRYNGWAEAFWPQMRAARSEAVRELVKRQAIREAAR